MKIACMSSGKFAKLCGTTKETLRHYNQLGLLKPKHIGDNGYQYYETIQYYEYYAIHLMKMTGTPLTDIQMHLNHQQIPSILQLLKNQQQKLIEQKQAIENMQFMVENSIRNLELGIETGSSSLSVGSAYFEEEHLLAVPSDEFSSSADDDQGDEVVLIAVLQKFKDICETLQGMQTDYQLGAIRPLHNGKITDLYMRVAQPCSSPYYQVKPAGHYLFVVQKKSWNALEAYKVLEETIEKQDIRTTGDMYAYDLAGFMINGKEENNMTIVSVPLEC